MINLKAMQMDTLPLDFAIIGAQKSATTSLYRYLVDHPSIAMPKSKEAPFFNGGDVTPKDLAHYNELHFQHALPEQLRGKASPQYMSSPEIPQRIFENMPNIKLIAILRDPIARSYSHYRMVKRRGTEQRSFAEIIENQLSAENAMELERGRLVAAPDHASGYVSESEFILAWSEYGRIMKKYFSLFPKQQILVLFANELASEPKKVLARILTFLGVDSDYLPDCLGETFHQGGDSQWVDDATKTRLAQTPVVGNIWRKLSDTKKQEIRYWFEQCNIRKQKSPESIDSESERLLRQHFSADISQLSRFVNLPTVWRENYLS